MNEPFNVFHLLWKRYIQQKRLILDANTFEIKYSKRSSELSRLIKYGHSLVGQSKFFEYSAKNFQQRENVFFPFSISSGEFIYRSK